MFHTIGEIYRDSRQHTDPPVSLHGQLLWREFFYLHSFSTPNFDRMVGNSSCRQIPWERNREKIVSWAEGRTGYPFIDAIMKQLRQEGWIHHLGRHAVACFLTRGDLWQHWEEGAAVFDNLLLDADWALNNANWQWLSCSNFFYQYFRCYSPVAFGKKTDPSGEYIRKYIPQLKLYPDKYIYEPWKAPINLQRQYECVVGVDYPSRIVIHEDVLPVNMEKMKRAYGSSDIADIADEESDSLGAKKSKTARSALKSDEEINENPKRSRQTKLNFKNKE